MKHNSLKYFDPLILFITLGLLLLSGAERGFAATSVEDLRKYIAAGAGLENNELINLQNGEMIAKLLPVEDKREVAIFGMIPVKMPLETGLATFQESLARQNQKSLIESGSLSAAPTLEELNNLTLEKSDIEDLKRCQAGNCKVKLSDAMIERFQKEVDWNAADYAEQANALFRRLMLDYLTDYIARGNPALIEYADQRDPVNLQKEYRALLKDTLWINDFAPELAQYLDDPTRAAPANLKRSFNWTKIKFGLKPVIVITETITYTAQQNGEPSQILSVNKQIYASHYFDSSLGLTALIRPPQTASATDSLLLYTNRSRSSSLDGFMSKLKHGLVEGEALKKLTVLLQDIKIDKKTNPAIQTELSEPEVTENIFEWMFAQKYLILLVLIGAVVLVEYGFRKQAGKKHPGNRPAF